MIPRSSRTLLRALYASAWMLTLLIASGSLPASAQSLGNLSLGDPSQTSGRGPSSGAVELGRPSAFGSTPEPGAGVRDAALDRPSTPAMVAVEHPIDPEQYTCGPGDSFDLHFWGQESFSANVRVDLEGRLFVPTLGTFKAAGESLAAVRDAIQKKARRQYPGLSFAMSLRAPRSFIVHVSEDVSRPGPYPSHALERVSEVIARAGGSGVRRNVSILRVDGSEVTADLQLYQRSGDTKYNPLLSDGDVVRVRPRELKVRIEGAVRYPGEYELIATRDLAELLGLSGGLLSSASRSLPIRLVRRDDKERPASLDLPWGDGGAPPSSALKDEDVVVVRSSDELQRSVLLVGPVAGADTLDGATEVRRIPIFEGDTVRTVIERAGGIKAPGDLAGAYINRRKGEGTVDRIPVNLEALLVRRDFAADRTVQVGDEIVVPFERRGVLVQGAVSRPGLYPYTPKFGVPEFIAHAGGRTRNARSMDSVSLVRPDGSTEPYEAGTKVGPGDAIIMPERNFSRSEVVSLVIAGGGLLISALTLALVASQ